MFPHSIVMATETNTGVGRGQNRRRRRKKPNVRNLARRVRRLEIAPETKYWYDNFANTISSAGEVFKMFEPGQGTGESGRIGNEVLLRSMLVRVSMIAGDSSNVIRFIVFVDRNSSGGVAPTVAQVLEDTTTGIGPLSPMNILRRQRFKVIVDNVYTVTTDNPSFVDKQYRKLGNMKATWSGTGSVVEKNALYGLVVSDSLGAPNPSIIMAWNVGYRDS